MNNANFLGRYKDGKSQTVFEHLNGVSELCENFLEQFNNSDWGTVLGLLHDLGKYSYDWQEYIRKCNNLIENKGSEIVKIDHSSAGGIYAFQKFSEIGKIIAYCIIGHHGGLPDCVNNPDLNDNKTSLQDRLIKTYLVDKAMNNVPDIIKNITEPTTKPNNGKITPESFHFWIRMLFSSLVDADCLDAEFCTAPEKRLVRVNTTTINELKEKLNSYMLVLKQKSKESDVNNIRNIVLNDCIDASNMKKGFYTLSVPTGGGKTLSSMMFALKHAEKHNMKRVIYAIPYCSIIEQTSEIYKNIFGDDNVVEHHSNIDFHKNSEKNRLASDNWDSPIIVTTNVQFFQSLFGTKPSICRKNHNIANSVIVLDEAQMINPEFLYPIIQLLKSLVNDYNCTVVFCSATQPNIYDSIGYGESRIKGINNTDVIEIIKDKQNLYKNLERVNVSHLKEKQTYDTISDKIITHNQSLTVVNTKRDCFEIAGRIKSKNKNTTVIHLSTNMCAYDRKKQIKHIKELLKNGESITVISTQLIEAGVDISFPTVFRCMCGLDSIVQASGRCNRNGELENKGDVFVFELEDIRAPFGFLRKAEDTTLEILNTQEINFSPETISKYFKKYYNRINNFDIVEYDKNLVDNIKSFNFQFHTVSTNFRLIDNATTPIIVKYEYSESLISTMKKEYHEGKISKFIMRRLQPFMVLVYENQLNRLIEKDLLENFDGIYILKEKENYIEGVGIIELFSE
jgi:CRISPR-associated endonuclease/helicase Cas3